jgi:hypothetical protein
LPDLSQGFSPLEAKEDGTLQKSGQGFNISENCYIPLGNRRDPRATFPLARCALVHPINVVQALAIVRALHTISAPERDTALDMIADHPARAVRRAVARMRSEP